eukprot:2641237-Pleurochrysis_carterae.AAC.4
MTLMRLSCSIAGRRAALGNCAVLRSAPAHWSNASLYNAAPALFSGLQPASRGLASLVGSIDQGTSSTRFIVFDDKANKIASHQMEHKQVPGIAHYAILLQQHAHASCIYPREGWCEHDPEEIINNVKECIEETLKKLEAAGYSKK